MNNRNRGNFIERKSCTVGDMGVHAMDNSVRLQVTGFDGSLVMVKFSEDGESHPCIREELLFPWDVAARERAKKAKKAKKTRRDEDEEDDDEDDY